MNKLPKPKSKKSLEKKLDKIFSEFIRLRDTDDNGYCRCFTCGNWGFWKNEGMQNGHFITRGVKATKFNEMNCHVQCVRCNHHLKGNLHVYRMKLVEMYGKEEVERLEHLAAMGGSDCAYSLELKIAEYNEKVKRLKNEKCL